MKLAKYLGVVAGITALVVFVDNTTDHNILAGLAVITTVAGLMLTMKA